ncbi:hypothetical protein U14_04188 [Candidatus Moduliflexus flocculans]|uniref:Uncharacterized protein n=1 Tax=Candidatus Moduliflexus flocculans TaxID=1499966 RepID=A0A0S6W447_9BACT|nr:hypothetical protein U14_04188 [Candidatus Moduliflexus flocculans]
MKRFVKLSVACISLVMSLMASIAACAAIGAEPNGQLIGQTADSNMMATTEQPMMDVPADMAAMPNMNMNGESRAIVPQYVDPAMKSGQMMTAPTYPMTPTMNAQTMSPYSTAPIQTMPMQPSYQPNTVPNYQPQNYQMQNYQNYMMPVPNTGVSVMPGMDSSNMYAPYSVQPQYGSADQSYNQAMQAYRMQDYWTAMSKFQEVATMYPQSDLADNAYYWIGEIYYASRNYAEAIRSFQTVMQMYPSGNKLPDAMLKMGFAYAEMQQYDVARSILSDVAMRFSSNARIRDLAAKKLQQLPMMMY